jgi:hypothetical protein
VRFRITGAVDAAPPGLVAASPANVDYVGYLGPEDYRRAVSTATLVLTLTTEPSSVMRSAYEAVYARVPLVTSDTAALREAFPFAVCCDNTAASIAAAVDSAVAAAADLAAKAEAALALQEERWAGQLAALREACAR